MSALLAGGAGSSAWANEFINDAEGAAYADWEDLYAKNAAVSCGLVAQPAETNSKHSCRVLSHSA
jgi:hypothetical protein